MPGLANREPKSLAFVVAHVERRPAGEFILTFENGEVWQQADLERRSIIERGDQVVIRRSTTGAFTLVSRDWPIYPRETRAMKPCRPMTARMKTIAMSVALIVTTRILFAADDAQHPCAHVRNDTDRLACYDQAFGKPRLPRRRLPAAPQRAVRIHRKGSGAQHRAIRGPAAADSVTAAIKSLDRRRDGKFVVTLDNTQVWAQSEFNSQADVQSGIRSPCAVARSVPIYW